MAKYIQAKKDKHWALTEYGLEIARVRAKFEEGSECKHQYERAVPNSWVTSGYVVEVDNGKKQS